MTAAHMDPEVLVKDLIRAGKLESAWDLMETGGFSKDALDLPSLIDHIEARICEAGERQDVRKRIRLMRRKQALRTFQKHGLDPRELIVPLNFQQGYQGKIISVQIMGGAAHGMVCLRGGDDWHREILASTKA